MQVPSWPLRLKTPGTSMPAQVLCWCSDQWVCRRVPLPLNSNQGMPCRVSQPWAGGERNNVSAFSKGGRFSSGGVAGIRPIFGPGLCWKGNVVPALCGTAHVSHVRSEATKARLGACCRARGCLKRGVGWAVADLPSVRAPTAVSLRASPSTMDPLLVARRRANPRGACGRRGSGGARDAGSPRGGRPTECQRRGADPLSAVAHRGGDARRIAGCQRRADQAQRGGRGCHRRRAGGICVAR